MAKHGLEIIDEDTGYIIENPIIKLNGSIYNGDIENLRISAKVKEDNTVRKQNIQIYSIKEEEVIAREHEEFGKFMFDLNNGKIFTKTYQTEDPGFSKKSYYQFWHRLCCNLDRDTNIVYCRKPVRHRVTQISEIAKICGGSNVTITKFIKECSIKGLIARFEYKKEKLFVLSPRYALNGNKMPILLYNLFDVD
ncbi:hypothetical protein LCGC14_1563950 [marine sediment metagenome]|uniref:Uncharacterized protein n=1 Tax=marine sediment metagenome TaxID=412755 RepID=A0A0F9ILQ4_9ZZZZ